MTLDKCYKCKIPTHLVIVKGMKKNVSYNECPKCGKQTNRTTKNVR